MTTEIYPIPLASWEAEALINKFFREKWDNATSWHSPRVEYHFSGNLAKDGNVSLHVSHNDYNGWCHSGGLVMDIPKIKPFTLEEIKRKETTRKLLLAVSEYERRKQQKEDDEIAAIHAELFGTLPEIG